MNTIAYKKRGISPVGDLYPGRNSDAADCLTGKGNAYRNLPAFVNVLRNEKHEYLDLGSLPEMGSPIYFLERPQIMHHTKCHERGRKMGAAYLDLLDSNYGNLLNVISSGSPELVGQPDYLGLFSTSLVHVRSPKEEKPVHNHDGGKKLRLRKWVAKIGKIRAIYEETPKSRVIRLLGECETCAQMSRPFRDQARLLKEIAPESAEALDVIWDTAVGNGHPHVRWLAFEIVAPGRWEALAPILVEGLSKWDSHNERAALLGAIVTVRNHRVPDKLRPAVRSALRGRLEKSDDCKAGQVSEQTEILCQSIDTFRDFAEAGDLALIRHFWQKECTFSVRLCAIEAATVVIRRFPNSDETATFFSKEGEALTESISELVATRMVAIANGTLLWRAIALLIARLGDETRSLVRIAKDNPAMAGKLRKLLRDAEQHLVRNKQFVLLQERSQFLSSITEELAGIAG